MTVKDNDLLFAKVNPNAKIPTKTDENAGRDVYACFEDDYMLIQPHTTKLIPTGIASAISSRYEIRLRDRGSNGSKGIHVNAGTIDSGFRGEWFVAWCNTNDKPVLLSKLSYEELQEKHGVTNITWTTKKEDLIIYPYNKAICQAEICEVPIMDQKEVTYEELKSIHSERGNGVLGSSGK